VLDAAPSTSSHTKPPERIRYQMLGAPTLLYRHAPSYLDPSNRPSTLTPQQLSMALYMNKHPIKDWFTNREHQSPAKSRKVHASSAKSAFLTSTYVPQPPRPWGRPHAWDWRNGHIDGTSKSKTLEDHRRQAELDADGLVEYLHRTNREKAQSFWGDVVQRNRVELQARNTPMDGNLHRNTTGFIIFCSDFINRLKQCAFDSETSESSGPRYHFQLACEAWNELTEEERSVYGLKAERISGKTKGQNSNVDSKRKELRSSRPKHSHTKRITAGFRIFRSEYMQSNTVGEDATGAERKAHLINCTKLAGSVWKEMTEDEKSVYNKKAAENKVMNAKDKAKNKRSAKRKQHGSTGKTTGFNIFRTEAWKRLKESRPLPAGACVRDRKEQEKCRKEISASWKAMSEGDKEPYKEDARRCNELASTGNASSDGSDLDTEHSCDSAGGRLDATSEGGDLDNFNKGDGSKEQLIGGKQQNHGSNQYVKLGDVSRDMVGTDIQLMHDRYLSSSRQHVESCLDYFSPFRRPDLGVGVPDEKDGIVILPMRESEGCSEDEKPEDIVETLNIKDDNDSMVDVAMKEDEVRGSTAGATPKDTDECISEGWSVGRNGVGGPSGHGNCLIAVPCQCQYCKQQQPSWFLIHPTGENLSCVAINKIVLPRSCQDTSLHNHKTCQKVDVGGRVLQISQCGTAVSHFQSANQIVCLVARTPQYCSILYVKSAMISHEEEKCSIEFHIQEESRIDLRAPLGSMHPSYLPVHVTCDQKTTVSYFTYPSFAILSCDYLSKCNTIHRVTLREEPDAKAHSLSSTLADISLIEFCTDDRLAVWAAARSRIMPKLSTGFFKARNGTVTGYGHSLFWINLRNESASLVWSPSHSEYITEGLHSINGIMTDSTNEHVLWVSSSSACKVWALDVRYKSAKVLVSWSLPSLCDDLGPQVDVTGIYGAGVLMSQPPARVTTSFQSDQPPFMFSVKKDPNSHAVGVHQFPSAMPRFHTKSLESAGFRQVPKLKYDVSSIARSSIFPLPDVSSGIFNIGLATLQCSSHTCLSEKLLGHLGYETPPTSVIYAISMTSLGDMYCHTLLQTDAIKETQDVQFPGIPIGAKAITIPDEVEVSTANPGCLNVSLRNVFPNPSSAITPHIVLNAGDCCNFKSFDIRDVLNNVAPIDADNEDHSEDASLPMASVHKAPQSVNDLATSKAMNGATFNLPCSENVETFRVASRCAEDGEEENSQANALGSSGQESFQHSLKRFSIIFPSEIHEPFYGNQGSLAAASMRNSGPISLPSSHMVVVKNEDNNTMECNPCHYSDDSNATEERLKTDMGIDLIKKLKSNYFNEKAAGQLGVKSEWSTDSD